MKLLYKFVVAMHVPDAYVTGTNETYTEYHNVSFHAFPHPTLKHQLMFD